MDFIKYTIILIPALSAVLGAGIVMGYPVQEYRKNVGKDQQFEGLPEN